MTEVTFEVSTLTEDLFATIAATKDGEEVLLSSQLTMSDLAEKLLKEFIQKNATI